MSMLVRALFLAGAFVCGSSASQWAPIDSFRQLAFQDPPAEYVSASLMARHLVQLRWSQSSPEELLCSHPKRKGPLPKVALGTQSPTLRLERQGTDMYVNEKLPVYDGCQVFISDKWKFMFIRQPKSSSTAVLKAIKTQLCGLGENWDKNCKHEEFRIIQSYDDIEDLEEKWRSYFVFTFVRNPWTRMLSAWKMFETNYLFEPKSILGMAWFPMRLLLFFAWGITASNWQVLWMKVSSTPCRREGTDGTEEFAKDSNAMRGLCEAQACCTYIVPLQRWKPDFLDVHISDQSHCVFLPGGESMVDFIGATETLDDDWKAVVREINSRAGTAFSAKELDNPNGHGTAETGNVQNSCELESVRSMFNGTTLQDLALQYAMDVVQFGYMT